jgi:hypothetical protein
MRFSPRDFVSKMLVFGVAAAAGGPAAAAAGQTRPPSVEVPSQPIPPPPRAYGATPPPTKTSPIEKLGEDRIRIGNVHVDLAKKEVTVSGVVNDVPVIEFIANTKGGFKSYESVVEADTNAIDFNLGLILIGLDRARSVTPRFHFDPNPPQGDPVEVWMSWREGGKERRVRAEELIYDEGAKKTLPVGRWVYTGSRFMPDSTAFLADLDGVLIGFVHTPAPLIERVDPVPGPYGAIKINPHLNLKPGTEVTVIVRALPLGK